MYEKLLRTWCGGLKWDWGPPIDTLLHHRGVECMTPLSEGVWNLCGIYAPSLLEGVWNFLPPPHLLIAPLVIITDTPHRQRWHHHYWLQWRAKSHCSNIFSQNLGVMDLLRTMDRLYPCRLMYHLSLHSWTRWRKKFQLVCQNYLITFCWFLYMCSCNFMNILWFKTCITGFDSRKVIATHWCVYIKLPTVSR